MSFWPKQFNPGQYSPEQRESIKIHEHLRQLEERVKALEDIQT